MSFAAEGGAVVSGGCRFRERLSYCATGVDPHLWALSYMLSGKKHSHEARHAQALSLGSVDLRSLLFTGA